MALLDSVVEVGAAPLLEDGVVALLPLELAHVRLVAPRAVLEVAVRHARQPKRRAGSDILAKNINFVLSLLSLNLAKF